jgi:hypothetical protein
VKKLDATPVRNNRQGAAFVAAEQRRQAEARQRADERKRQDAIDDRKARLMMRLRHTDFDSLSRDDREFLKEHVSDRARLAQVVAMSRQLA